MVSKKIISYSVNNNWKPVTIFTIEGWNYKFITLNVFGVLSNVVGNKIGGNQEILFLV